MAGEKQKKGVAREVKWSRSEDREREEIKKMQAGLGAEGVTWPEAQPSPHRAQLPNLSCSSALPRSRDWRQLHCYPEHQGQSLWGHGGDDRVVWGLRVDCQQ